MSKFSDVLNFYIEKKQTKLYTLSRLCQIDRTTLYRLTRGKQCPSSVDTVIRLAEAMKLTPQQKSQLCEAWEITSTGEELWYQRRAAEHLLLNVPNIDLNTVHHPWSSSDILFPDTQNTFTLKSHEEFRFFLETMLTKESQSVRPQLMLLLQPEHTKFTDLLLCDPRIDTFDIHHILCLNNHISPSEQNTSFFSYNIECLEALLPLHIYRQNFHSYYYYDNVQTHFHSIGLMPCMILTGSSAITCSADFSFGIAHTDPATVTMLGEIFRKYINSAHSLVFRNDCISSEFVNQFRHFLARESVLFGPDPYIFSWLSPEILQKYLTETFRQNTELFQSFSNYLAIWKEYSEISGISWYTTRASLEHFMATGRISSLPEGLLHPLSCRDRHLYLEYLCDMSQTHCIRLVNEPLSCVPNHFHMYISTQSIFLTFPSDKSLLSGLIVNEPCLVDSFSDLFTSASESGAISQKETREWFKSMI